MLRAEFWAESEPHPALPESVGDAKPGPSVPDEVVRQLLSEARRVFSAMVWGFEFVYVPYDKARGVAEIFEVKPLGEIPWGDPRLSASGIRAAGTQLRAYVEYRPDAAGASRWRAWRDATCESAQGRGAAPLSGGAGSRIAASDHAAREALRALLRPIVKNKPREIRGVFAYGEAPRIVASGGSYVATLRILVRVEEVRGYPAY